jgi:predicted MPP superfamily phosphohydrolase
MTLKSALIPLLGISTPEAENFETVMLKLTLPRLDPAFDGYRLVQISDIHMGTGGMDAERLSRIVELVNMEHPDAVAITGDFTTHGSVGRVADSLLTPLRRLRPKDFTVAILGNHDHVTDPAHVREIIRAAGIIDVNNSVHTLRRGNAMLHFGGVNTVYFGQDRLDKVMEKLPAKGCAILLAHEPDFADKSAKTGRFDLQISGHSHGGQVRLPVINRPILFVPMGRKYAQGQYQVKDMIQYTNRGVGAGFPPVRFNCRPEITVFTLRTP